MSISSYMIAVDCDNAAALAQFWSAVLGEPVAAGSSEEFAALQPSATGPGMIFCKVPEPKTSKNRVHLDLAVAALDDEVSRIAALGGREITRFDQDGGRWVTLADPEGNEFDLTAA
jgi:predicted enzyme related to lactoylglutathione lyase